MAFLLFLSSPFEHGPKDSSKKAPRKGFGHQYSVLKFLAKNITLKIELMKKLSFFIEL
jgi:hypothetical protein